MESNTATKVKAGVNDHLANERTFLAWVRTSIGIMGFGFVVVKFSLFIRQLTLALEAPAAVPPRTGFSQLIGTMLVALGGMTILFAYYRYQKIKKQLDAGTFSHSDWLLKASTVLIFLCSILLLIYLFRNIS